MVQKIDQALAAANLLNMGFAAEHVPTLVDRWSTRQAERTLRNMSAYARALVVSDRISDTSPGRLFVSFHYSSYSHLYQSIAFRSKDRTISSLVGQQSEAHQEVLAALANQFGFGVRFIQSGPSMVRAMRQALRDGHSGMILLDIPWSKSQAETDLAFDTAIGSFQALSTTLRLITMIDQDYGIVIAKRDGETISLHSIEERDFARVFERLGEAILECPDEYERLHQLHKFCRLRQATSARVAFSEGGSDFAVDAKTMRFYRLNPNPGRVPAAGDAAISIEPYV